MCGKAEWKVTGETSYACWCHCQLCRKHLGAPANIGFWIDLDVEQGSEGELLRYRSSDHGVRASCKTCGSFAYYEGTAPNGKIYYMVPLATLEPAVEPTFHMMVKYKGPQKLISPDPPQFEEFNPVPPPGFFDGGGEEHA